jgi:hypothetical protein
VSAVNAAKDHPFKNYWSFERLGMTTSLYFSQNQMIAEEQD